MRCFDWSRRIVLAAAAIAAAAGCKGPDPTGFSCSSSAECPGGYHCDLGTAAAAGSMKCANGAPAQKTLTADATKFLLIKAPSADGAIRTTIEASLGAVAATPDFVGVRVIASQGGTDLGSSQVLSDGSILKFGLPQATAQVSLRVQDDSGHSVTVDHYNEQVEVSFVGKEVAGNTNGIQAFDVTNQNDGLFNPATWISSGPGPGGGKAKEFTATDTLDGGVVASSASYASIAYPDYDTASTANPPLPNFGSFSPPDAGTPIGWQPFNAVATAAVPQGSPAARTGATIQATQNGFFLFGGVDASGTPVDAQGAFQTYDANTGWTFTSAPTTGQLPTSRSGAALGGQAPGGSCFATGFVPPCDFDSLQFSVAGGENAAKTMNAEVFLNVVRESFTSISPATFTTTNLWVRAGTLPFANSGMQSAGGFIPFNAVVNGSNSSQIYAGGMMIYGRAVTAANSGTQGCLLFGPAPQSPGSPPNTVPIQNNLASCVGSPSQFDQATGGIGFRTGATLIADSFNNPTIFYLFGGRKATGPTTTALMNDIWRATITCVLPVGAACPTVTTWQQIWPPPTGPTVPAPTARAGAGGALWANGRLIIHGGTDVAGVQSDFWEFDFGANAWRQVPLDQTSGILSPPTRSGFLMTGNFGQRQIFVINGSLTGGALTDQLWLTGRESASKLLVKLPFSLPAVDQAQNLKLTVDAAGAEGVVNQQGVVNNQQGIEAFIWDGTTWRFIGATDFTSIVSHLVATPTPSVTGFLQPDGNIYLLFIQTQRNQSNFTGFTFQAPVTIDRLKATISFH